ncbi:MAG TPA: undecaprenyl-diphosphate phosphatase [Candidatus Omnitrophota bacterium]|nr:undecaprenyl-diphosphate phosphatase [Candidatus Omnitrophota bacterium]HOX09191.1 undecaprenyl-diphosphate phosphatase [Candidatus Omnitrophota bacterium]HPN66427.1 undecaprenyl-diphosphate phosphatase [Candidatus Omnitrophota bacterium]HRZ67338.1 undecaprenyl-diphosphate phosphatase [Candidatus Omnitrophota bacterium]
MNLFQAVVLGLVQGLGEFLPISSSAHLIVFPWLFGWPEHSLSFDVALHAGTLFAVMAYFWKDWLGIIKSRMIWYIAVASVPGALVGKLLESKAETAFRSPMLIAFTMSAFAALFYLIDRFVWKSRSLKSLNLLDAVIIGLSQALAIIPGVSRSGITMASGLGLKFDRESAAKFSFMLSAPIILGAVLLKLGEIGDIASNGQGLQVFTGFAVSAVTGFLAIKGLLGFVKKHSFSVFIIYRFVFSAVILAVFLLRK